MSTSEAIRLAVEALRESAEKYHFDNRYVRLFGKERVPAEVRRGVQKREELLEAVEVLQTALTPALSHTPSGAPKGGGEREQAG